MFGVGVKSSKVSRAARAIGGELLPHSKSRKTTQPHAPDGRTLERGNCCRYFDLFINRPLGRQYTQLPFKRPANSGLIEADGRIAVFVWLGFLPFTFYVLRFTLIHHVSRITHISFRYAHSTSFSPLCYWLHGPCRKSASCSDQRANR